LIEFTNELRDKLIKVSIHLGEDLNKWLIVILLIVDRIDLFIDII
jgi:hypothetical protein